MSLLRRKKIKKCRTFIFDPFIFQYSLLLPSLTLLQHWTIKLCDDITEGGKIKPDSLTWAFRRAMWCFKKFYEESEVWGSMCVGMSDIANNPSLNHVKSFPSCFLFMFITAMCKVFIYIYIYMYLLSLYFPDATFW